MTSSATLKLPRGPIGYEQRPQSFYRRGQLRVAGDPQVGRGARRSDIQVFVKQIRMQFGQPIDTDEEYDLEFEPFDVFDVEYAYIAVLPSHPPLDAGYYLDVVLQQGSVESLGHRFD